MPILRTGRNLVAKFLTGEGTSTEWYGSTGAILWSACSSAAHDAAHTFLQSGAPGSIHGSTMAAGYPSRATNVIQWRGVFSTAFGNYKWGEIGLSNATSTTSPGTMLFRLPDDFGTKTSAQSWQLTACVTITT